MAREIRIHMGKVNGNDPLSGTVEIDESMVGGKRSGGKRGRGAEGKTVVFGMLEKQGRVKTQVVPNVKRKTLYPIIEAGIIKGSTIHSDELRSYVTLAEQGYGHETVNHGRKEFVRDNVHTNSIEGFWSRLQVSIRGTHVHVSSKHLSAYADEFSYRYNCRANPAMMLPELLSTYPQVSQ